MKYKTYTCLSIASLLASGCLNAATTFTYNFNGGSAAVTVSGTDGTAGAAAWGAFATGASSPSFSSSTGTAFARGNSTGTNAGTGNSLTEAITNDAYLTVTITAGATDVSLDSITWDHRGTNIVVAEDFRSYLLTQTGGFSNGSQLNETLLLSNETTVSGSATPGSIITAGNTEEIRFYLSDFNDLSSDIHRLDNIVIGISAVPEPSSAALLGLGGLALILRRRK